MPSNSIRWVHSDGCPLDAALAVAANDAHIPADFVDSVLRGEAIADVFQLAFRDPDCFVARNLHCHVVSWQALCDAAPCELAFQVLGWIKSRINVLDFLQPFKGQYKGECFNSRLTPTRVFPNNTSCGSFQKFVHDSITNGLASGSIFFFVG